VSRLIDPGASSLKLARTVLPEQVQFGFQGAEVRRCPRCPVVTSMSRPACLLVRCSSGYEPPGLAAVGKAGDGGDFVHVHAGVGNARAAQHALK
jgi:hypothetical protein